MTSSGCYSKKREDPMRRSVIGPFRFRGHWQRHLCTLNMCYQHIKGLPACKFWLDCG